MTEGLTVELAAQVTDDVLAVLARLLQQLVDSGATALLLARLDGAARRDGVGEALVTAALDEARARGAATVDLTTRPLCQAAIRLCQRLGSTARDSCLFRHLVQPSSQPTG